MDKKLWHFTFNVAPRRRTVDLLLPGGCDVELKKTDVSILQHIALSFLPILARCFDSSFTACFLELVKVHDLCANEASFEIAMNCPCALHMRTILDLAALLCDWKCGSISRPRWGPRDSS